MLALLLAAALVGLHTPSRNITCVDTGPSLVCNVRQARYTAALQQRCMSPPTSLDWHGFELSARGRGQVACSGGGLVLGRVAIRRAPTARRGATARTPASRAWPASRARIAHGTACSSHARRTG